MLVIPVIDVRGGVAVAARRGERALYRPLESALAPTADPVDVARALRSVFPFPTLYVADLDAIEGRGVDPAMHGRLAEAWPGSELWIDDGMSSVRSHGVARVQAPVLPAGRSGSDVAYASCAPALHGRSRRPGTGVHYVLGAESVASLADYGSLREAAGPSAPLSLDFRGDAFLGPPALLDDATLWPDRVIVMTLARVGSGEGPDLARLAEVVARARGRNVYAAGGVRNVDDLRALRDIGAAGALVATALHDGRLGAGDLEEMAA